MSNVSIDSDQFRELIGTLDLLTEAVDRLGDLVASLSVVIPTAGVEDPLRILRVGVVPE